MKRTTKTDPAQVARMVEEQLGVPIRRVRVHRLEPGSNVVREASVWVNPKYESAEPPIDGGTLPS